MRTASKPSINRPKEATFLESQAMGNLDLANGNLTHCMLEDILVEVIKEETSAKTFEFGLVLKTTNPKLDFYEKSSGLANNQQPQNYSKNGMICQLIFNLQGLK